MQLYIIPQRLENWERGNHYFMTVIQKLAINNKTLNFLMNKVKDGFF